MLGVVSYSTLIQLCQFCRRFRFLQFLLCRISLLGRRIFCHLRISLFGQHHKASSSPYLHLYPIRTISILSLGRRSTSKISSSILELDPFLLDSSQNLHDRHCYEALIFQSFLDMIQPLRSYNGLNLFHFGASFMHMLFRHAGLHPSLNTLLLRSLAIP
jgi:hypothetical protein